MPTMPDDSELDDEAQLAALEARVVEHDVTEDEGWEDDPRWQGELRDWLIAVEESS